MQKIYKIKGKIQNYAWGGSEFIPKLLNENKVGGLYAEYWLGAHKSAPSVLDTSTGTIFLDEFLQDNTEIKLGKKVSKKFGRLPFLFKVLDVKDMLSIQVHPTKIEAEKGFQRENEAGIPLTASNRNYKDDNHKPEIMVALGEFWLLHGFLPKEKLKETLKNIPEFKRLLPVFENEGYQGLYSKVMEEPQETTNLMLNSLIDTILPLYKSNKLSKSSPDYWAAKAMSLTDGKNIDKGIYSIYFFNIVKVDEGEAIFQDAGIPHAYLEGQNMELMANSDNVLRGGLTPKHVDVQELLKHTKCEATIPNIMKGELQPDGLERVYKSPAPDFELSQIKITNNDLYKTTSKTASIVIVISGTATINECATTIQLKKGESAFLLANSKYSITTASEAILYKATAP